VSELPIQRTWPKTPITRPNDPVPAVACLRWQDGTDHKEPATIEALVMAWSEESAQIYWHHEGQHHIDWISIKDVRSLKS
jgi:hypothetical protein